MYDEWWMDIFLDIFYEVKIYKISLKTLTISRTSEIRVYSQRDTAKSSKFMTIQFHSSSI